MKLNRACANLTVTFLIYSMVHYLTFEIYFSIIFISNMNDNSSEGKISFIQFHSVNFKGNWTHFHNQELRLTQNLTYHENALIAL